MGISATRFQKNPIIVPGMLPGDDGQNINGPSILRVPGWIARPLGRYYLYFAHHQGRYIRMAYADHLNGPWKIYQPGVLRQRDTIFGDGPVADPNWPAHIASPDVHVYHRSRRLVMYFHGMGPMIRGLHGSSIAVSKDGLRFRMMKAAPLIPATYLRAFTWNRKRYLVGRLGQVLRYDGDRYVAGPNPFEFEGELQLRHPALRVKDNVLEVYYSMIGDCPERIMMSSINLHPDWTSWRATDPAVVLEPDAAFEGSDLPEQPSRQGMARRPVKQLRDPAIFEEDGVCYLLYTIQGERGIAIARLDTE